MELLFPLLEQIKGLELDLQALPQGQEARLAPALKLAWAVRQSAPARCLQLLDEVEAGLTMQSSAAQPALRARALCIRAEQAQLQLRTEAAERLSQQALALFARCMDHIGQFDSILPLALQAFDHGELDTGDRLLAELDALAAQAGDRLRARYAALQRAYFWLPRDVERAQQLAAGLLTAPADESAIEAATLAALRAQFLGLLSTLKGDLATALHHYVQAYQAALDGGQLSRAILCCCSVAYSFGELLDNPRALEWVERGTTLAEGTGWVGQLATLRYLNGTSLLQMEQFERARQEFADMLTMLAPHPELRMVNHAMFGSGLALLKLGLAEQADTTYRELLERLRRKSQSFADLCFALEGHAKALLALQRLDEARATANEMLALARRHGYTLAQLSGLQVLAAIDTALSRSRGEACSTAALHTLREAEGLALDSDGQGLSPELLEALADALAGHGEHEQAFLTERRARLAAQQQATQQAQLRALALQAHFHSEQLSQENQYLRALATADAEHIGALTTAQQTLEQLSLIGQQLTAQLQPAAMFKLLARHMHQLLALDFISVYRLDAEQGVLVPIYAAERERAIQMRAVPLDSPVALSAACVRKGELLLIDGDGITPPPSQIPGASVMASMMFSPLKLGDRITGVISLQARQCYAFGQRERLICASLSAYVAIALDNARAYSSLAELQRRVAEQEKLAALGGLVAGVAHEINTPVGNSLLAVSTLIEDLDALMAKVSGQGLRRSDLDGFGSRAAEGLQLILGGLQRTGALVRDFKSLAVHHDEALAREAQWLDLPALCLQRIEAMAPRFAQAGIAWHIDGPPTLALHSIPAALDEVLAILLDNALTHAFPPGIGSRIDLRLRAGTDHALIQIEDDGRGIDPAWLPRIFEPFATTRLGQGRSGLGLARARNLVHGLLDGELQVDSAPARGSQFTLRLPLRSVAESAALRA
ncbi:MAG: GAF domain-containing sensor histidine kinase [Burkholderiaceae bacterium]|nr:GAF domain-containing sensor histidine kinase [Burkholderiaceae bacterium]